MGNLKRFEELEAFISKKAGTFANARFAFTIILPEEKYDEIIELFVRSEPHNFEILNKFPWCQLKLITETYVRAFVNGTDVDSTKALLEKRIGTNFPFFWDGIPDIIERLNLEKVRGEGGPWYIYANVVLHAGIPSAYFDELYEMAEEMYISSNFNTNRAVEGLCSKEDIFRYSRFSKYFKEAFGSLKERKMLFQWLVQIVDISHRTEFMVGKLTGHLPPHLLSYLRIKGERQIPETKDSLHEKGIRKGRGNSFDKGLVFNPDKGTIECRIPIDDFNFLIERNYVDLLNNIKLERALRIRELRKTPYIQVSFSPEELTGEKKSFYFEVSVYNAAFSDSVRFMVFDSDYNVIVPGTKEIFIENSHEALLTIISENECESLKNTLDWGFHEDLSDEWFYWNHYSWRVPIMNDIINLPEPYGEIRIVSDFKQSKICGEWISEVQLPKLAEKVKQFGGDSPPSLRILVHQEYKPVVLAEFFCGDELLKDEGHLRYMDDCWQWESSLEITAFKAVQYTLNVRVYNMDFEENEINEFSCVWCPTLMFSVEPESILWPSDSCMLWLTANDGFKIDTDIPECDENLKGGEFSWIFNEKPPDCSPVITLIMHDHSFDFVMKLPYLSAWVLTHCNEEFEANELEWTDLRPFERSVIKRIAEKDYRSRIRFRLFSKESKTLSIYERSTYRLIRKLIFDEDGHDSISCAEILKYKDPIIRDNYTEREVLIFKKTVEWGFQTIYERTTADTIYRNCFDYRKNKL